jgi:hypothetical protein
MNRVPLHTLPVGGRFGVWSQEKDDIGKTGVVIEHTRGSSTVRYDGYRDTQFTSFGEDIRFSSPNTPITISLNTEVIPL